MLISVIVEKGIEFGVSILVFSSLGLIEKVVCSSVVLVLFIVKWVVGVVVLLLVKMIFGLIVLVEVIRMM